MERPKWSEGGRPKFFLLELEAGVESLCFSLCIDLSLDEHCLGFLTVHCCTGQASVGHLFGHTGSGSGACPLVG